MTRLGMEEGEPIEHRMISRAIANAQAKVEGHNFDIRKHLLEYDDVMNKQREVIYHRRRETLGGENLKEEVLGMIEDLSAGVVDVAVDGDASSADWDWDAVETAIVERFGIPFELPRGDERHGFTPDKLREYVAERAVAAYETREATFGSPVMRHLEKVILLQTIDQQWKDHLLTMDRLKEGVGLRGYAQQNPLQAYQKEGFTLFGEMIARIESEATRKLFTVQLVREDDVAKMEEQRRPQRMTLSHGAVVEAQAAKAKAVNDEGEKLGRNDPCPCGSGKKYKKCHGR
jgi:preprotein translocase subunit SecA